MQMEMGQVHSMDVAEQLQVSKPSVSGAMKALREKKLVVKEEDGVLHLTEDGEELADIYSPSMFEEILKEAAAQTGAAIDTGSWSRSLKEEIGTLTITIKYLD